MNELNSLMLRNIFKMKGAWCVLPGTFYFEYIRLIYFA